MLRAFTRCDLAPGVHPYREIVTPGQHALAALDFAAPDLGSGLGSHQYATGRGRGLGETVDDLDS